MSNDIKIKYDIKPLPSKLFMTGVALLIVGLLMTVVAYMVNPERATFNGIVAFMFLLSVGMGSLFLIALEYVVSADWSVPFRRIVEILSVVIFVVPLLSIPLFVNLHDLFHWTHLEDVMKDPILKNKAPYLNEQFFAIRTIATFVLMFIFWFILANRSFKQDKSPSEKFRSVTSKFSALFMPIFAVTLTFMAIDWMMSLEPHWFSTIYGVYYFAGSFSVTLAIVTLFAIYLNERGYMHKDISRDHYYNFGGLMFAFTNFWAYIAFSQFILIWYANIPEETFWYLHRWEGSWMAISIGMVIIHFIVPYAVLLPQPAKSDTKRLKFIAVWLIFAHFYDLYWLVMPTFDKHSAPLSWMELYPMVLCSGIVILAFTIFAKNKNLIPIGDNKLPKGLNFHL